jgi:hypothetical protein
MAELVDAILDGHSAAIIRRLVPGKDQLEPADYGSSLLSLIIAKVIRDYPVATISQETVLRGRSILDLYRTVETLISHYEDLCDEIFDLLVDEETGDGSRIWSYRIPPRRMQRANRRLLGIANDMRDIAGSLDMIIDPHSPLHQRLREVLELCTQISLLEDMLLIRLGAPPTLPDRPLRYNSMMGWHSAEERRQEDAQFPHEFGQSLDDCMVDEMENILGKLNTYKVQLRSAIAAARAES